MEGRKVKVLSTVSFEGSMVPSRFPHFLGLFAVDGIIKSPLEFWQNRIEVEVKFFM